MHLSIRLIDLRPKTSTSQVARGNRNVIPILYEVMHKFSAEKSRPTDYENPALHDQAADFFEGLPDSKESLFFERAHSLR